jgi:hypothetical protein
MAKKFMYVCLGIMALAVAFHIGATSAISQLQEQVVGITAICPPANIYLATSEGDCWMYSTSGEAWYYLGNPFEGVAAQPTTWGQIKAEFGE